MPSIISCRGPGGIRGRVGEEEKDRPWLASLLGGESVPCPKCHSNSARYQWDGQDVWLRCLCGVQKLIESVLEDTKIRITHIDAERDITLPRHGSKLHACFVALRGLQSATTGEIANFLNYGKKQKERLSNSDVASQLTVLKYKGLTMVIEEHKGVAGGSIWTLTDAAVRRLGGHN